MPSIEQLERLLAADPDDAFVHYALALEHAKLGDHGTALTCYDRCLAIDEQYCYAYFHKAKSLEELGRSGDACVTLEAGLAAANRAGDSKASSEISSYLTNLRLMS